MEIRLLTGEICLIDDEDYPAIKRFSWRKHVGGYASAKIKGRTVLMHQVITGVFSGDIDHANLNKLDNRRENLRPCTRSQNKANQPKHKGSFTSSYKGVDYRSDLKNKWRATIRVNYKKIHLGLFSTEQAAAQAYDRAAIEYFGEFASLNFPGAIQ